MERIRVKNPTCCQRFLEYMDRRTGQRVKMFMSDIVFLNWRTGEHAKKQFL